MECVVDTGRPNLVAIVSQVAAAIIAAINPKAMSKENNSSTIGSRKSTVRIPFLTVSVTASPAKNAPQNSNIAAIITACLRVSARDPTEVPIAFATSFAPIFHDM